MRLLRSSAFIRAARRLIKKNPSAPPLRSILELLGEDPSHPRLRSHRLKGKLSGSRAASVTHDLRIVFEFVDLEGERAILLESVGLLDQV